MKARLALLCIFTIQGVIVSAQQIRGLVVDEKSAPISYATVVVETQHDFTFVYGTITDEKGQFETSQINGLKDKMLHISVVGYKPLYVSPIALNQTYTLKEDAFGLSEVVIEGRRIEKSASGYVANLKNSMVTKGKTVAETLPFLPGVTKTSERYSINGLPVSEIYINGFKVQSLSELESMQGGTVNKIKVEYLAGSSYKADIAGGIIRIETEKPKEGGYYGDLSVGAMSYPYYKKVGVMGASSFNYRLKKWSLYNNLYYQRRNIPEEVTEKRLQGDNEMLLKSESSNWKHEIYDRLSLTYDLSKTGSIGASFYISGENQDPRTNTNNGDGSFAEVLNSSKNKRYQGSVNYSQSLGKKSGAIEIKADYLHQTENLSNHYLLESNPEENEKLKKLNDLFEIQGEYTVPLSKKQLFKVGGSYNLIKKSEDLLEQTTGSTWTGNEKDDGKLRGNSYAGFAELSGQTQRSRYALGVRVQNNDWTYTPLAETRFSNSQWGFCPSVNYMYMLNKRRDALTVMFKTTLNEVPYSVITPYKVWDNPNFYRIGNTALKAPRTNIGMVGLSLFQNKLNLMSVIGQANNQIIYETLQDKDNAAVSYTRPININSPIMLGFGVESMQKITKWWMLKASAKMEVRKEDSEINEVLYDKTNLKYNFFVYNNFNFKNDFGGSFNLSCEPTFKNYQRTYESVYQIYGSFYKYLCKKSIQLKLNYTLYANGRKLCTDYEGYHSEIKYSNHREYLNLSVVWLFKGGKKNVNVKKTSLLQDINIINDQR